MLDISKIIKEVISEDHCAVCEDSGKDNICCNCGVCLEELSPYFEEINKKILEGIVSILNDFAIYELNCKYCNGFFEPIRAGSVDPLTLILCSECTTDDQTSLDFIQKVHSYFLQKLHPSLNKINDIKKQIEALKETIDNLSNDPIFK